MAPELLKDLSDQMENPDKELSYMDRLAIADYLRHSAPMEACDELIGSMLQVIVACEESKQHSQKTHAFRNVLAKFHGYKIVQYM